MDGEVLDPLLGKILADRYEIRRRVARGGMGTVYVARDIRLKRVVILKVPTSKILNDEAGLKRFQREIRGIRSIEHPQVVPIFDAGEVDGVPWFVQRYMRGGDLGMRIPHEASQKGLSWLRQVSAALDYCHTVGLVHRDVKPSNILFDESGLAYISDFGVARWMDQENQTRLTRTGQMPGSPAYMAPEQALGGEIKGKADQYALGVCAYEGLAGKLPFEGATGVKIAIAKHNGDFTPLHEVNPALHRVAGAVVGRALSPDPDHRFDCCEDFSDALADGVRGRVTALTGAAPVRRQAARHATSSGTRAHRANTGLIAGVVGLGLLILLGTAWFTGVIPGRSKAPSPPPVADAPAGGAERERSPLLPTIVVEEPAPDTTVRSLPLRVRGRVLEAAKGMVIRVGSLETRPDAQGVFALEVMDLEDGPQTLRVTYECLLEGHGVFQAHDDGVEKDVEVRIDVALDAGVADPRAALALTEIMQTFQFLHLEGHFTGASGDIRSVEVDGTTARWENGTFKVALPLKVEDYEKRDLEILAKRERGRVLKFTRQVVLKPMVLVRSAAGDPTTIHSKQPKIEIEVTYRCVPRARLEIILVGEGGKTWPRVLEETVGPGGGRTRVTVTCPGEGVFRITAGATDPAGKSLKTQTREGLVVATIDHTPPSLESVKVTRKENGNFSVAFVAHDNVAKTLRFRAPDLSGPSKPFATGQPMTLIRADTDPIVIFDDVENGTTLDPKKALAARAAAPLLPEPSPAPAPAVPPEAAAEERRPDLIAFLRGDSAFKLGTRQVDADFTLEGWFRPTDVDKEAILFAEAGKGSFQVRLERKSPRSQLVEISARVITGIGTGVVLQGEPRPAYVRLGDRVHVALTRTGRAWGLHVDGKRVARAEVGGPPVRWSTAFVGAVSSSMGTLSHHLQGEIHLLRLSAKDRYGAGPDEVAPSQELPMDSQTVSRYDFDRHAGRFILSAKRGGSGSEEELSAVGAPELRLAASSGENPSAAGLLFYEDCSLTIDLEGAPRWDPSPKQLLWNVHLSLGPLARRTNRVLVAFPWGAVVWDAPRIRAYAASGARWTEMGSAVIPQAVQAESHTYSIQVRCDPRKAEWPRDVRFDVDGTELDADVSEAAPGRSPWSEAPPPKFRVVIGPAQRLMAMTTRPMAIGACHIQWRYGAFTAPPSTPFGWAGTSRALWRAEDGVEASRTEGKETRVRAALRTPSFIVPMETLD